MSFMPLQDPSVLWSTILQSANYAIISTSPEGVITTFNPAAERLLGYGAAEVVGIATPALFHLEEETRLRAEALAVELGTSVPAGFDTFVIKTRLTRLPDENEWRYRRKDGSLVPILLSVTAMVAPGGEIIGYLGIASDLSERKKAEQRIRDTLDMLETRVHERTLELETAVRHRDEFLSIASHELNTPLTPLLMQVQLLKRNLVREGHESGDARVRKSLDVTERQVERLHRLVSSLLDVSRITSGKLKLDIAVLDTGTLIREALERVLEHARSRHCEFQLDLRYPRRLAADAMRLEQVISNLLSNAIKYAPGTRITVSTSFEDDHFVLKVADRGLGIPADDRARIFDRFERAASSDLGGLGLGLYITRQIVMSHGGTIHAEENPGGGSIFVVRIPAPREELTAPAIGA